MGTNYACYLIGVAVGFFLHKAFHWIDVHENRKYCKFDPETRCWHK